MEGSTYLLQSHTALLECDFHKITRVGQEDARHIGMYHRTTMRLFFFAVFENIDESFSTTRNQKKGRNGTEFRTKERVK